MDQYDEEFQIIIEADNGQTLYSDIAIDDVALMNGAQCLNEKFISTSAPVEETGGVFNVQTCLNRCQENRPVVTDSAVVEENILNGAGKGGTLLHCDCFDGCEETSSCCIDYNTQCVFGS